MLSRLSLTLPPRQITTPCGKRFCRGFTTASIHVRLPTTVYRLQLEPKPNLVVYKEDGEFSGTGDHQISVSEDGLVYPRISEKAPTSNGPVFMPNTILMQDLARNAFDQYLEEDETRRPVLLSIKKGTLLPSSLVAFYHDPSQFSLQPLRPMRLSELNSVLSELYAKHATIIDAEKWFDENPFHDAAADADIDQSLLP